MRPIHLNTITLVGRIQNDLHQENFHDGEPFYHATVAVQRQSGTMDYLPISIPGHLLNPVNPYSVCGRQVRITGELRSYNMEYDGKHRHLTQILAADIVYTDQDDGQHLALEGAICRQPTYRVTPLGREISDLMIAVDRERGSSYIPVVVWGRDARKISRAQTGTIVHIKGRFQSRIYTKKLEIGGEVERTAFEVSASACDIIGYQRRLMAE